VPHLPALSFYRFRILTHGELSKCTTYRELSNSFLRTFVEPKPASVIAPNWFFKNQKIGRRPIEVAAESSPDV